MLFMTPWVTSLSPNKTGVPGDHFKPHSFTQASKTTPHPTSYPLLSNRPQLPLLLISQPTFMFPKCAKHGARNGKVTARDAAVPSSDLQCLCGDESEDITIETRREREQGTCARPSFLAPPGAVSTCILLCAPRG